MPKKTLLTEKEKKAVEVFLETGNQSKAVSEAYETNNPDQLGSQVFARPRVKEEVQRALDRLGITGEEIISRFRKQATKGKNDAAKVRANENLAQIADLYPARSLDASADKDGIAIHFDY